MANTNISINSEFINTNIDKITGMVNDKEISTIGNSYESTTKIPSKEPGILSGVAFAYNFLINGITKDAKNLKKLCESTELEDQEMAAIVEEYAKYDETATELDVTIASKPAEDVELSDVETYDLNDYDDFVSEYNTYKDEYNLEVKYKYIKEKPKPKPSYPNYYYEPLASNSDVLPADATQLENETTEPTDITQPLSDTQTPSTNNTTTTQLVNENRTYEGSTFDDEAIDSPYEDDFLYDSRQSTNDNKSVQDNTTSTFNNDSQASLNSSSKTVTDSSTKKGTNIGKTAIGIGLATAGAVGAGAYGVYSKVKKENKMEDEDE